MVEIAERVNCPSCGAPLSLVPGEVIVTCAYCGTATNMAVGKKYFLRHSIIPSRYDAQQIEMIVRDWMSKGFLKPQDLASRSRFMEMELTFTPFFVFHVRVATSYQGLFTRTGGNVPRSGTLEKEYYWKVLGRRASDFPTKEYDIPLSGKVDFDMSRVQGGSRFLNAELDESEARSICDQEVGGHQRFLLSQDVDVIQSIDSRIEEVDSEFVHAPVWRVRYSYGNQLFTVMLDGASGQVIKGDFPQKGAGGKGLLGGLKRSLFSG